MKQLPLPIPAPNTPPDARPTPTPAAKRLTLYLPAEDWTAAVAAADRAGRAVQTWARDLLMAAIKGGFQAPDGRRRPGRKRAGNGGVLDGSSTEAAENPSHSEHLTDMTQTS